MSVATRYRNLPIKHKLRFVIMATVIATLMVACAAVLAYDQMAARISMRNDLRVLAEIFSAKQHRGADVRRPAGRRGTPLDAPSEAARNFGVFVHGCGPVIRPVSTRWDC